jgi:hypothetical protein
MGFDGNTDDMTINMTTLAARRPNAHCSFRMPLHWRSNTILHTRPGVPDPFVRYDNLHPIHWPDEDHSPLPKWRLDVEYTAFNLPEGQSQHPKPLTLIRLNLFVVWSPEVRDFTIDDAVLISG